MMFLSPILLLAASTLAAAATTTTLLYVSSYDGNITTLSLNKSNHSLTPLPRSTACSPSPSWLTLQPQSSTLYCLNEGNPTPDKGSLSLLTTSPTGNLTPHARIDTPPAPVHGALFRTAGCHAYRGAHYTGQVSGVRLPEEGTAPPALVQALNLSMPGAAGPVAD